MTSKKKVKICIRCKIYQRVTTESAQKKMIKHGRDLMGALNNKTNEYAF